MNSKLNYFLVAFLILSTKSFSQDVGLYNQFSGRVDFTMIGNTLNTEENGVGTSCTITTSSSASLNLTPNDIIISAYLYWSGSGTGDLEVNLNDQAIVAERTFNLDTASLTYFSAFANITNQIQTTGNGNYTLSNLDLTNVIENYCPNATNFGGWAIIIIYSNDALPINQINLYDGLESISAQNSDITIQLNNLNVIDNTNAKVGFLAWEGDSGIAQNESLKINGNLISNPPLNPANNVFNGTNSFTGANDLYNMDLDFYNIEDYINVGDNTATIQLTSTQDFVMINSVITKLNTQLPDATVNINSFELLSCNEREVAIGFTIFNIDTDGVLSVNTPVSIYANNTFITTFYTQNDLLPNQSENFSEIINIPLNIPDDFTLIVVVDDDGNGNSTVFETNEFNNEDEIAISLFPLPIVNNAEDLLLCDIGLDTAVFNLEETIDQITTNTSLEINFFTSESDLILNENEITIPSQYTNTSDPQTIFVRIENPITNCYAITTFLLKTEDCFPVIPEVFTPNNDEHNSTFTINGLHNIFVHFEIYIYNRYGNLVYKGHNNKLDWDGTYKGKKMPVGTYFYKLYFNDVEKLYTPIKGWVYLNR